MTATQTTAPPASRRKLLIGGALALGAAAVALVVFVLPAEFGIDPTGAGEALGLTKLSEPENIYLERGMKRTGVLTLADAPPTRSDWADRYQIELAPYESIEMKYTLRQGQPMEFAWSGTGVLDYDMHSHPFEGGEEATESYSIDEAQAMQGRYVAAFSGLHGWFWQNRTMAPVTLTLQAAGPMTASTVWEGGIPRERPLARPDEGIEARSVSTN